MENNPASKTATVLIRRFSENAFAETSDHLVVEEPLEISVCMESETGRIRKNIGTIMRTPGHDEDLATGYLFTTGIISSAADIRSVSPPSSGNHKIEVELREWQNVDFGSRVHFGFMSAACGICGINSVDALTDALAVKKTRMPLMLDEKIILGLPARLSEHQQLFGKTGGIHAAALFRTDGEPVLIREDIGRHNALDKVIGAALRSGALSLDKYMLLLSGRAGFELMQKAGMADIPVVVSVGAPSGIAVEMAKERQITLIGFLRGSRFNLYSEFDKWTGHEIEN